MTPVSRLGLALSGLALASCLPGDTRPPPATVHVTAASTDSVQSGLFTADSWRITFSRFLVSIGRAELNGDACNSYSDAEYRRILNMVVPGSQKVSVLYALGTCSFAFSLGNPGSDALLGAGVSEADKTFMRTAATDRYESERGVSIYVVGRAVRESTVKTFSWAFRQRIFYDCAGGFDGGPRSDVHLQGNQSLTLTVRVRAEPLFQVVSADSPDTLGFDLFAKADSSYGNGDGEVSLDELGKVPLIGVSASGAAPDAGDAGAGFSTLEDYVYLNQVPKLLGFEDPSQCVGHTSTDRRDQ